MHHQDPVTYNQEVESDKHFVQSMNVMSVMPHFLRRVFILEDLNGLAKCVAGILMSNKLIALWYENYECNNEHINV